ncbi:SIR2 family protein (plasmid) [Rhizobium phaseoli]|uniref:SIR2 family NAD-dependent protein deacylase n=1 Tax=Rhizobium phaseoli TaxID=396 RepID=UPI0007EB7413|nr:SIR2 family protein [Rhizobium phaseoli]ANL49431.1 SIR2 family protein [Rhizobium phaseoli]
MRLHHLGPDFPEALVNELLEGNVVFLCGAGVSAPQLPNFRDLVLNVYNRLGEEHTPAEDHAFQASRYEEVLGALSRRLVRSEDVIDAAAAELQVPANPDTAHHDVILRLSRDQVGRPIIVTTNFDTLFERSLMVSHSAAFATQESAAGQDIPAPGSARFTGVVHIHGRLTDDELNLSKTELVLTSAQYGEAYLRAGWAARFLFDLMRCRTLVLVGYTANDAPVRYILNVLEGDRERFTDLRRVYALSSSNGDPQAAAAPWQALAVDPLLFEPERGNPYGPLWSSLEGLANLVENPDVRRREMIAAIVSGPVSETTDHDIRTLKWALGARADLFEHFITRCEDAAWFDTLAVEIRAFGERARAWMLARWFARGWDDRVRYLTAIKHLGRGSQELSDALFRELDQNRPQDATWEKAWRLLAEAAAAASHDSLRDYQLRHRLNRGPIVESDLGHLVNAIGPHLTIEAPFRDEDPSEHPNQLSDIARFSMESEHQEFLRDVLASPAGNAENILRLLERGSQRLSCQLRTARDAELIGQGRDVTDFGVPSVVNHQQNQHRRGFVPLTVLITSALPMAAQGNLEGTKRVVEGWRAEPFNLTTRLWMHALTQQGLFTADEAIDSLATSSEAGFWSFALEFVAIVRARIVQASGEAVDRLVRRLLVEGPQRYADREPSADGIDWQDRARDRDIWVRLTAIGEHVVLPQRAEALLHEIRERRTYLSREIDERDLFRTWSSGVRAVRGRTAQIVSAQPSERLTIADRLEESSDIEDREGWGEYCREDPVGAYAALRSRPLEIGVVARWATWLEIIPSRANMTSPEWQHVIQEAVDLLGEANDEIVNALVGSLARITEHAPQLQLALPANWWDRMWQAAEGEPEVDWGDDVETYDRVINSTGGALAEALLQAISSQRGNGNDVNAAELQRLQRMIVSTTYSGKMARAACVRYLSFAFSVSHEITLNHLRPFIAADNDEGRRLRGVLVEYNSFVADAEISFADLILQGVRESRQKDVSAANAASHLVRAVVASFDEPNVTRGISPQQARQTLREAAADIRVGALKIMTNWLEENPDEDRAAAWTNLYGPTFQAIWPRDRSYLSNGVSKEVFSLATAAGAAFDAAVEALLPYVSTFEDDWLSLHDLERNNAELATRFPVAALRLVWAACGPPCKGRTSDIAAILDAIAAASPALAVDRRVHKLRLLAVSH